MTTPESPAEPGTQSAAPQAVRRRTIVWDDPLTLAAAGAGMSGLDFMQAMADGRLPGPPISATMNMTVSEVAEGRVVFGCMPDESHYNPLGTVHGGLVCTLLDSVLGCAGHTTLAAGVGYTSIDISVSYLRAVHPRSAPLTAIGRVTKPGRRVIFTEGEVLDVTGAVVATAHSSLLVLAG